MELSTLAVADSKLCDKITLDQFKMIQPYGFLLVIDRENLKILYYSQNMVSSFGIKAEELDRLPVTAFLKSRDHVHDPAIVIRMSHKTWKLFRYEWNGKSKYVWVYIQQEGHFIFLEMEFLQEGESVNALFDLAQEIMGNVRFTFSDKNFTRIVNGVCKEMMKTTQYQRVVVYQFDKDHSGIVVGEAVENGLDSYYGLRFPATDIPQHVREAYISLPLRYIPSVDAQPVGLISTQNVNRVDSSNVPSLNNVMLRMVAPVHVKYMKNMGINASASMGIIYGNTLWGIIACHAVKTKYISVPYRFVLTMIANTLAAQLVSIEHNQSLVYRNRALQMQNTFSKIMSKPILLYDLLDVYQKEILELISSTGMSVYMKGDLINFGQTPSNSDIFEIVYWLQSYHPNKTFVTDHLPTEYIGSKAFKDVACGLLAVPIASLEKHVLLFYRPEKVRNVEWGGDPEAPFKREADDYSPRASFERWIQTVSDHCMSWGQYDIASAEFIASVIANKKLNDLLQDQATHDPLTGLLNRTELPQTLMSEIVRGHRHHAPLSILLIDIDFFKTINDTYGHMAGDLVLVQLGEFLRSFFRGYDFIYRYGGEEFMVVMPDTRSEQAMHRSEELRQAIKQFKFRFENKTISPITISIGVAEAPLHATEARTLIARADHALYEAKLGGRDRVMVASQH